MEKKDLTEKEAQKEKQKVFTDFIKKFVKPLTNVEQAQGTEQTTES